MSAKHRLEKLRGRLLKKELDALLVSVPENRRYLSGFSGSAGYLLITRDAAVLATDFRYVEQGARQAPDFRVERIAGGPGWFPKLALEMGGGRVGFESQNMTVAALSNLKKAVEKAGLSSKLELVETTEIVEKLRAFKDEEELRLLARAVEIADEALQQVAPTVVPGTTEREVAWELEKAMRERGADGASFDTIVAAGPDAALPHHRADDKVIERGECVVIDMGAVYQGYCSDLTRTLFVGEPNDTFRRVYETVLHAQLETEEEVRAGMSGQQADAVARNIIAEAGYGDNFGHSLGHGVGLAVHELPGVGPSSEEPLEDGMVFTIEPGIYLPGWGGVRIEDMVVLEEGRARVLSRAPKLQIA